MEQLETVYFPRVSQYRFCQLMIDTLPKLREDIKEISMSDLKDFLESIRKHSDKIGETAMKQVSLTFFSLIFLMSGMQNMSRAYLSTCFLVLKLNIF